MYFENIYNTIIQLWKKSFKLDDINNTQTYIKSIIQNFNDIDFIVDQKHLMLMLHLQIKDVVKQLKLIKLK